MPPIVPQSPASCQPVASPAAGRALADPPAGCLPATGHLPAGRADRNLISVSEPWEWTESAIRASVSAVRAGHGR